MEIIYTPQGRAAEYAGLALNIYNGCPYGCRYCYAPASLRKTREEFHTIVKPKKNIIQRLKRDCEKLVKKINIPEILISFIGDPYPSSDLDHVVTWRVIKTLIYYDLPFTILTKSGLTATQDFDLLSDYDQARFGTSLTSWSQSLADYWEPNAATVKDRIEAIMMAKTHKILTWVSLEPVIDPAEAIKLILAIHPVVDRWKIGKINYIKEVEGKVDWIAFRDQAIDLLDSLGADYYIKNSLRNL